MKDFSNEAGRCVAVLRGSVGMIGSFEVSDDIPRATALLKNAASWLRSNGAKNVIGPMDGDTWHRYRVNAGPFDTPSFLLEPVNPPHWDALWRGAGFEVIERYSSKRIADVSSLMPKLAQMHARALRRGYRIRPFDLTRLQDELTLVWQLSLEIFRENAWYSDISVEDFLALYQGIDSLLVPELVLFIEHETEPVGFLFAYPDSDPHTVNYKTIGVVPAHRRGYVAWALLHRAYTAALAMRRPVANHCLMREENPSQSMDGGEGVTFRHYYLYAQRA